MRFKRFMASISIAIIALTLALVAVPAQASKAVQHLKRSNYQTDWTCISYSNGNVKTCELVNWSVQSDGNGVRLEGFQVWTPDGCGALEGSGGRYNPVNLDWLTPAGSPDAYYTWGAEGCSFFKDMSNNGSDLGAMKAATEMKARVDLSGDRWIYMTFKLFPNGTYDVLSKFTVNAP